MRNQIALPDGTTSSFIVFGDGEGAAALTPEAPQNQFLSRLGFDLTDVPEDIKGDTSMGKDRGDIISLALENVQAGLPGDNWISVSNSKDKEDELRSQPAFSPAPAVVEDRLYTTAPSTFRLDYFSANILLAYESVLIKSEKSRPLGCSESKIHHAATFSAGFFYLCRRAAVWCTRQS